MTIALPALAVAFAAFCVWLAVRIFNRRERWAKWTAIGLIVALAYPASFGPACWWFSDLSAGPGGFPVSRSPGIYWPIGRLWNKSPDSIKVSISWYATLGTSASVLVPSNPSGSEVAGMGRRQVILRLTSAAVP